MEERFLKLANTAYKILEFLPEQDPLKNKAKEKVLAILENLSVVLGTDGWASLQKEKALNQLVTDIDVFLSYLKIAKSQRWIDDINFLILQKEYDGLKKEIPVSNIAPNRVSSLRGSRSAGDEVIQSSNTNSRLPRSPMGLARNDEEGLQKQELTERQKKILEMLDQNEKAQVSDIIKIMPDITKRTIRRDLDGLLEMGKVVRVGEWNQVFYKKYGGGTILLS